ncbi:diol dehydratase reactivase [Mycolicibacterium poriferae]|nr:diol dehydratase reactivase [Mycolicibacterium poriferae]
MVAGIDVGNHTTELVLSCVHDGEVTPQAHGHAPTRGRKGSLESLQGAAALLHRVEVDTGLYADELVISALRPVDTATAPMPPASTPGAPVRSLRRPDASTAGGTGYGVGRHVPLQALTEAPSDEPVVVSVDSDTDFEAAASALTAADRGGWRIVGVLAAQDDAVLIRNRIPFDVPVVDEVDLAGVAPDALIAVEVVAEGRAYRATADPIALAAALKLPADRLVQVAEFCRELADSAAIAVTASTGPAATPDRDGDFADCRVDGELRRYSLAHAHAVLRQAPPGCVEFIRLGKVPTAKQGLAVHDAFFTDLGAVDNGAWLRRGLVEASGTVVALLAADEVDDAAATLTELTGRPARTLATEPEAAARGARSTPGLPADTMVCDIGGGTIDLIGSSRSVVAAGAGEAVTVAVADVLGVPRALAEQVKRSPAVRVEGPHVAHEEDGRRVFLDAPAQSDAIGRLCTRGPAGLVPFSSRLAAEEWRSLRLAIKQETVAANIARALRGFDRPPSVLVLAGGGALDDELMRSVSEALRSVPVVVGRANVLGVHGPRFAVAAGLVEMYAAGR